MPDGDSKLNARWAATLVNTLYAKGLRHAVLCPGSRCTPLTLAFAGRQGIDSIPVLDERSAGFFALGIAKREDRPVAVVCTSGTAAANLFPAVVEAKECGAPLIVITADRPKELRKCRAGQTIDQVKLFGSYPVDFAELATPADDAELFRYLRGTVSSLWDRSRYPRKGPVHINVPLREPLTPSKAELAEAMEETERELVRLGALDTAVRGCAGRTLDLSEFVRHGKGVLLVGSPLCATSDAWVDNVAKLAACLDWPVLADALNPVRNNAGRFPNLISSYHALCRAIKPGSGLMPERAIVVGDLPISKTLRSWLQEADIEMVFLAPFDGNFDSSHSLSVTRSFDFNRATPDIGSVDNPDGFTDSWKRLDEQARLEMSRRVESGGLFEGRISYALSREIGTSRALYVSNSLPPRDMELFWEPNDSQTRVYSSRGANGIDGILSTALGLAHGGRPTVLLTGDLALLHDSNGALICKQFRGCLTIVLLNNRGGGIFNMLPVSELDDDFERYFATDQDIDFAAWAATYGIAHTRVDSVEAFVERLREEHGQGVRLIEVLTDRSEDAEKRKAWIHEIAETIASS